MRILYRLAHLYLICLTIIGSAVLTILLSACAASIGGPASLQLNESGTVSASQTDGGNDGQATLTVPSSLIPTFQPDGGTD